MKTVKKEYQNTIVAFHIGRGGRFHNSGHKSFLGCRPIGDFTDELFSPINADGSDNNAENAEYTDGCGNGVGLTNADVISGIGCINIDNDYDTTYAKYLAHCDEDEQELVWLENEDMFEE